MKLVLSKLATVLPRRNTSSRRRLQNRKNKKASKMHKMWQAERIPMRMAEWLEVKIQ